MEIKKGQKELMRLTLSASGQLIEKKDNEKDYSNGICYLILVSPAV